MEGETVAGILPYEAEPHADPLLDQEQEALDAAREIKISLAAGETSKAVMVCDRMLSLHPGDRLFEGLRLEIENKEREVRLEFIRRLCAELESTPDLDARINAIQQALNRYPNESQLVQLLKNTTGRRDIFNSLISEARTEELAESYAGSLKRWHLIRELYPTMPGLETQIRRVESLADSQRRMRRRAEFVDAIFRLSSTGEYTRAVYQCINALAEYPNDGGLLTLKRSIEEKAQHATELQKFIAEGLTFLQGHEADAALEAFAKARTLDQSNLQVRYLISIALLEKARAVMSNDRRKLTMLLDEVRNFMPNAPELQALSLEPEPVPDESWENALVRIEHPAALLQQQQQQQQQQQRQPEVEADPTPAAPRVIEPPPAPKPVVREVLAPTPKRESYRNLALIGLAGLGALSLAWLLYPLLAKPSGAPGFALSPSQVSMDVNVTPNGADILIDGQKVGASEVQTRLNPGKHTVSASLVGYDSQSVPVELGSQASVVHIDLRPIPLHLRLVTDQPGGPVWIDNQLRGDIADREVTINGVEPGVRTLRIRTPSGDVEMRLEFPPGKPPIPKSLPSRQVATVLFVGSAGEKSHLECNCAPAGLKVGALAELIRAAGLELPLVEGRHSAELWVGKNFRKLTIDGSRSPMATIAVFPSFESKSD
jgi:tetratricopeptide (TPR) repeat protein